MLKNKKGSIQDLIFVGVILLFASMVILIGFKVSSEFNTQIQDSPIIDEFDVGSNAQVASASLVSNYSGVIDNTFLLLAIGISIITLVLAALVRVHPMFIPFFLLGLLIVIFMSGVFSNIYQEMAADPNLSAQADQLTFISYIMEYLPFIIGIFGFLLMAVTYKLWKNAIE